MAAGALALGLPALANALIARRAARLPPARDPLDDGWREEVWTSSLGTLALRSRGDRRRPAVLFLHSLGPGHSGRLWVPAAEHIARKYRVVLIDHLGWGDSERPAGPYDLTSCLQILTEFAEHGIESPFHVVASGESSPMGLGLAATHPGVRSLALSGPAGIRFGPSDDPGTGRRLADRSYDLLLGAPILGTSAVNAYARRSEIENNLFRHLVDPPTEQQLDEHYRLAHLPGSERALSAFLRGRYEARLDEFDLPPALPLWIGWGRKAMGEPVEDADLWLAHYPQADLAVFENSASWPHVDQPREFAGEVQRFLRGARA